jgi:hypothetical protein
MIKAGSRFAVSLSLVACAASACAVSACAVPAGEAGDLEGAATQESSASKVRPTGHYLLTIDDSPSIVKATVAGETKEAAIAGTVGPLQMVLGSSMGAGIVAWVQSSLTASPTTKDGRIVTLEGSKTAGAQRTFYDALITEVGFPALDVSSDEPVGITLTVQPSEMRVESSVAKAVTAPGKDTWHASHFTFSLAEMNTKAVSKIDAITVKQTVAKHEVGEQRDTSKSPGATFSIELPASELAQWTAWSAKGGVKPGSIVYLDDAGAEIGTLVLGAVAITSIAPEKSEANAESIKKVKIELYVEQMKFLPNAGKT